MAKSKYDWTPLFDAYHKLPKNEKGKRIPGKIENYCKLMEKEDRVTPLHVAAKAGLYDICKFYLDEGLNVNAKARLNNTPLYEAAWNPEWPDICRLLLDHGADPLIPAKHNGRTPFHVAAESDVLCRIFLDYEIDPNIASTVSGYKGMTPFLTAAEFCSPETLQNADQSRCGYSTGRSRGR